MGVSTICMQALYARRLKGCVQDQVDQNSCTNRGDHRISWYERPTLIVYDELRPQKEEVLTPRVRMCSCLILQSHMLAVMA